MRLQRIQSIKRDDSLDLSDISLVSPAIHDMQQASVTQLVAELQTPAHTREKSSPSLLLMADTPRKQSGGDKDAECEERAPPAYDGRAEFELERSSYFMAKPRHDIDSRKLL